MRIPDLRLDPAGEYHDARARFCARGEAAGSSEAADRRNGTTVAAAGARGIARAGGGEEADRGQAPGRRAGAARAGGATAGEQ